MSPQNQRSKKEISELGSVKNGHEQGLSQGGVGFLTVGDRKTGVCYNSIDLVIECISSAF